MSKSKKKALATVPAPAPYVPTRPLPPEAHMTVGYVRVKMTAMLDDLAMIAEGFRSLRDEEQKDYPNRLSGLELKLLREAIGRSAEALEVALKR